MIHMVPRRETTRMGLEVELETRELDMDPPTRALVSTTIHTVPRIRETIRTDLEVEPETRVLDTAPTTAIRTIATEIRALVLVPTILMAPRRPEAIRMAQETKPARRELDMAQTRETPMIATEIRALVPVLAIPMVPRRREMIPMDPQIPAPRAQTRMDPQTLAPRAQIRMDPVVTQVQIRMGRPTIAPRVRTHMGLPEIRVRADMARLIATRTIPTVQEIPTQVPVHMDLATPRAPILMDLVIPARSDSVTRSRVPLSKPLVPSLGTLSSSRKERTAALAKLEITTAATATQTTIRRSIEDSVLYYQRKCR